MKKIIIAGLPCVIAVFFVLCGFAEEQSPPAVNPSLLISHSRTNPPPPVPTDFVFGVSQGTTAALPWLQHLNIEWTRIKIPWKQLTPSVIEPELRLKDVLGNAERVRGLAQRVNWQPIDAHLQSILDRGIRPIVIVGHGYSSSPADLNGQKASPDIIGRGQYLAQMYWTTRALVERYDGDGVDDAANIVIKIWQTENELNEAALTAVWGWRAPSGFKGLKSAWADWDFLTSLLRTLSQAVKDADPEARTLMNFHTDVPSWISRLAGGRGWRQAVRDWSPYMDIIGMDAYPNYFDPLPVAGEIVGQRVALIKNIAPDKPVYIVETDYPAGPAGLGFSPQNQAKYLRASYVSARAGGAAGYFKFSMITADAHTNEITATDLARIKWVRQCVKKHRWIRLAGWTLTHLDYIEAHFLNTMQAVEGYWGVITREGKPKPALDELRQINRRLRAASRQGK